MTTPRRPALRQSTPRPPIPRHPGSRVVDNPQNLIQVIAAVRAELRRMRDRTRPETLTFTAIGSAVAATSGTFTATHDTLIYRSGDTLYADVLATTGASSVVEVQLAVPDLSVTGTAVATAAGGTERTVRVSLPLPATWEAGAAYRVRVQARRVSGADSTAVRVLRAWQR